MDRDPLYAACARKMLIDSGTNPVRLPTRSPDLNAFAERFVLYYQVRVPEQDHPTWREASSLDYQGVYGALPRSRLGGFLNYY